MVFADESAPPMRVEEQYLSQEQIASHLSLAMKRGVLQIPAQAVASQADINQRLEQLAASKRYIFVYVKGPTMTIGLWAPSEQLLAIREARSTF